MIIFISLSLLFLAGCQSADDSQEGNKEKLEISTTIFALEDFISKIGGEYVDVQSIYPPNADAHTYEPSSREMVDLAKKDMFIYSGVGMEPFASKAEEILKDEKVEVATVGDNVSLRGEAEDHDHGDEGHHHDENEMGDPHVFIDPVLSIQLAENIKDLLIEQMPEHEEYFTTNFEEVKEQLEQLDQDLEKTISEANHPQIIISHAAYGYWEDRYGLEQISIHGLSSSQEPSQSALVDIVDKANEYNLKYVVFENNISSKVSEIIQSEIGADSAVLRNMETISEEDLDNGEDYFSLMQKNIETLQKVLND